MKSSGFLTVAAKGLDRVDTGVRLIGSAHQ